MSRFHFQHNIIEIYNITVRSYIVYKKICLNSRGHCTISHELQLLLYCHNSMFCMKLMFGFLPLFFYEVFTKLFKFQSKTADRWRIWIQTSHIINWLKKIQILFYNIGSLQKNVAVDECPHIFVFWDSFWKYLWIIKSW